MVRSLSLAVVLSFVAACGSSITSVPVKGADGDRARLTGAWKGEFEGANNHRSGTIDFNLEMGRHTADAKVVMQVGEDKVQLKVAYLEVDSARLVGKIEPYLDPSCNCTVQTDFEGSVSPGFIVGTYRVRPSGGQQMTGSWSAERIED